MICLHLSGAYQTTYNQLSFALNVEDREALSAYALSDMDMSAAGSNSLTSCVTRL